MQSTYQHSQHYAAHARAREQTTLAAKNGVLEAELKMLEDLCNAEADKQASQGSNSAIVRTTLEFDDVMRDAMQYDHSMSKEEQEISDANDTIANEKHRLHNLERKIVDICTQLKTLLGVAQTEP